MTSLPSEAWWTAPASSLAAKSPAVDPHSAELGQGIIIPPGLTLNSVVAVPTPNGLYFHLVSSSLASNDGINLPFRLLFAVLPVSRAFYFVLITSLPAQLPFRPTSRPP
jgi:hypothetical protein